MCAFVKVMSDSLRPHSLYSPWNSPGQNAGVGSLSLLQGIFPTQGSNPGLLHCRQIIYQLSHKRSLEIREWVAYPFSSGSSQPRNQTGALHCRHVCLVMSNSLLPHGLQPASLLSPRNIPGKNTEWVAISYSGRSFQLRDAVHVPCVSCVGKWILSH